MLTLWDVFGPISIFLTILCKQVSGVVHSLNMKKANSIFVIKFLVDQKQKICIWEIITIKQIKYSLSSLCKLTRQWPKPMTIGTRTKQINRTMIHKKQSKQNPKDKLMPCYKWIQILNENYITNFWVHNVIFWLND